MRRFVIAGTLLLMAATCRNLVADDGKHQKVDSQSTPSMELFSTLNLTEFRLPSVSRDSPKSAKEILTLFKKLQETNQLDIVQSIRLSTVENTQGMVRVSETGPDGRTLLTRVQFRFAKSGERILCDLDFQKTHANISGVDNPELQIASEFMSTIVLQHGKPTLVGGVIGTKSSFLVATIEP